MIGFEEVERVSSMLAHREIAKVNVPSRNCCRRKAGRLFLEPITKLPETGARVLRNVRTGFDAQAKTV
jgi:hypothetical protein